MRRNMILVCVLVFAVMPLFCGKVLAQRAIENATEFTQSIVDREEDASNMQSQDSGDNIEWQDTASPDNTDSGSQQDQQGQ